MGTVFVSGTAGFDGAGDPSAKLHGRTEGTSANSVEFGSARVSCGSVERDSSLGAGTLEFGVLSTTSNINIGADSLPDLSHRFQSVPYEKGDGASDTLSALSGTTQIATIAGAAFNDGGFIIGGNVVITNASNVNNNGTFPILSLTATTISYTNASGVVDATTTATLVGLSTSQVRLSDSASDTDDYYNGMTLTTATDGTLLENTAKTVSDYDGGSRIATISVLWTATSMVSGTAAKSGSTALTGTGTQFSTDFAPGDLILIDPTSAEFTAERHVVATASTPTALTTVDAITSAFSAVDVQLLVPGGDDAATSQHAIARAAGFTGVITIGHGAGATGNTSIAGAVTMGGSTTLTGGASTVDVTDNLVLINDGSATAAVDSGILVQRNSTDLAGDSADLLVSLEMDANSDKGVGAGSNNVVVFDDLGASGVDSAYNGATVILPTFASYLGGGATNTVLSYVGATTTATTSSAWTPVTGTGTATVNSSNGICSGAGTAFDTEFQVGDAIEINSSGEVRTINSITSAISMNLDAAHAAGTSGAIEWVGPGGDGGSTSSPAEVATALYVGVFWDESADVMATATTLADPGAAAITIENYAGMQAGHLQLAEMLNANLPSPPITDIGIMYTKVVTGNVELFYRDDAGTQTQITDVGTINFATSLQAMYDQGSDIIIDTGSVTLTQNNGITASEMLDLNPGVLANTEPIILVTWQANTFTNNMRSIELDYSDGSFTHSGAGGTLRGINLIGNSGLGNNHYGILIDANWSNAIVLGASETAFTNITNEGIASGSWDFQTTTGGNDIDAMDIVFTPGQGGAASGGNAGGAGGTFTGLSGKGGARDGANAAGVGGIIDIDAGNGGAGVASSVTGSAGGNVNINAGDGAASAGAAAALGGAVTLKPGDGGASAILAVNAGDGAVATWSAGVGGVASNGGGGDGGFGGAISVRGGTAGTSSGGIDGNGGAVVGQGGAGGSGGGAGGDLIVRSGDGGATGDSGDVLLDSGTASNNPGNINFGANSPRPSQIQLNAGGTPSTAGFDVNSTGAIELATDIVATDGTATGSIAVATGTPAGTGASGSGDLTFNTGNDDNQTASSDTGAIDIISGDAAGGGFGDSGDITISTGVSGGAAGPISFLAGPAAERADVVIGESGDTSINQMVIYSGSTGGSGNFASELVFQKGSTGNYCSIWVDSDGKLRIEDIGASLPGDGVKGKTDDATTGQIVGTQGGG